MAMWPCKPRVPLFQQLRLVFLPATLEIQTTRQPAECQYLSRLRAPTSRWSPVRLLSRWRAVAQARWLSMCKGNPVMLEALHSLLLRVPDCRARVSVASAPQLCQELDGRIFR